MILSQFNQVLGAGGFGEVRGSTIDPTVVAKFIRDKLTCEDGSLEFESHHDIYKTYQTLLPCLQKYWNNKISLRIAQPYEFFDLTNITSDFRCVYIMERILPPDRFNALVQLSLSQN